MIHTIQEKVNVQYCKNATLEKGTKLLIQIHKPQTKIFQCLVMVHCPCAWSSILHNQCDSYPNFFLLARIQTTPLPLKKTKKTLKTKKNTSTLRSAAIPQIQKLAFHIIFLTWNILTLMYLSKRILQKLSRMQHRCVLMSV